MDLLDEDAQNLILDQLPLEKAWWVKRHHNVNHTFWPTYLRRRFGSFKKVFRILAERQSNTRKKKFVSDAFRARWSCFYVSESAAHEVMESETPKDKAEKLMVAAMATGLSVSFRRLPDLVERILDATDYKEVLAAVDKYANDLLDSDFATLWENSAEDLRTFATRDTIHEAVENFATPHAHSAVLAAWVERPY